MYSSTIRSVSCIGSPGCEAGRNSASRGTIASAAPAEGRLPSSEPASCGVGGKISGPGSQSLLFLILVRLLRNLAEMAFSASKG